MAGTLSREELIDPVRRIVATQGSQEEIDTCIRLLERSVPDPQVTNYIFYSTPAMAPEEIVDRALSYRPISLPGSG